jgi:hypothetical protein
MWKNPSKKFPKLGIYRTVEETMRNVFNCIRAHRTQIVITFLCKRKLLTGKMPWLNCHSIFLGRGEMLPELSFVQTAILSVVAIPIQFGGVTVEAKKILYAILVR